MLSESDHSTTSPVLVVIDFEAATEMSEVLFNKTSPFAFPAVVFRFSLIAIFPPKAVIGPAIVVALANVILAVLVD